MGRGGVDFGGVTVGIGGVSGGILGSLGKLGGIDCIKTEKIRFFQGKHDKKTKITVKTVDFPNTSVVFAHFSVK